MKDLPNPKKGLALQKVLKVWEWEKVTKIKTVTAWLFRNLIFYEKYFCQKSLALDNKSCIEWVESQGVVEEKPAAT